MFWSKYLFGHVILLSVIFKCQVSFQPYRIPLMYSKAKYCTYLCDAQRVGGGGGGFWTDRGHFTFLKKVWSLFSISTQGDEKLLKSDQDLSPWANYIPCSCCIFTMNNWLTILSCKNIHREVILITLLFLLSIKEHFNVFNTGNYFTC